MRRPPATDAPRSVTILGATGSIGRSTTTLLKERPDLYRVVAVTGGSRVAELAATARTVGAGLAAIADPRGYGPLKDALSGSGIAAAAGPEAVREAAQLPADWVMSAIAGFAGLAATMAAVARGAIVALANKECIVCAGPLLQAAAQRSGAVLLPVDSEHNAIFQALGAAARVGERAPGVERLILTASGGPFRHATTAEMAAVTPASALAHPIWAMGAKISIDSATMMNKGLEILEANRLFGMPEHCIEVVVHPQSIVHSLVGFEDGSLLAQLGTPDMRIPISHALGWPARLHTASPRLDLVAAGRLDFEAPDPRRFPALALARRALRSGSGAPTILNAANEVAVEAFLAGRIGFLEITKVVEAVLDSVPPVPLPDLDAVFGCDAEARGRAQELVGHSAMLSSPAMMAGKAVLPSPSGRTGPPMISGSPKGTPA